MAKDIFVLNAKYKIINLKTTVMSLNYLKVTHENSLLELHQKYKDMCNVTLGKIYRF